MEEYKQSLREAISELEQKNDPMSKALVKVLIRLLGELR